MAPIHEPIAELAQGPRASPTLSSALAFEGQLALLAVWELDYQEQFSLDTEPFTRLWPSPCRPGKNPAGLFFDALKDRVDCSSTADMLEGLAGIEELSAETLYRWSAGLHFPDKMSVKTVMRGFGQPTSDDPIYAQLSASKLLNLLGYLGSKLSSAAARKNGNEHWPWPKYPWGYETFVDWSMDRWPVWRRLVQTQFEALVTTRA